MLHLAHALRTAVAVTLSAILLLSTLAGVPPGALASPAALLVVDNNGDASGQPCTLGPSDCSLRSAVQIANATPGATIAFDNDYTITLSASLALTGSFTTISNLGVRAIRVNANNVAQAFVISGSDVQIDGLRVYGAGTGTSNIYITGSAVRVIIKNSVIGPDANGGACLFSPNAYGGIFVNSTGGTLAANDARVWIYHNDIACNHGSPGDGVTLNGTDNVAIGEDENGNAGGPQRNFIGFNVNGVVLDSSANTNRVRNSDIDSNSTLGVHMTGGASYNVVSESAILSQFGTGIQLDGGAQSNVIGNDAGQPRARGNLIAGNLGDGIYISGSNTQLNTVQGNNIGTDPTGFTANGNSLHGIVLDNGAAFNSIGFGGQYSNLISGNKGDGIQILNGASYNFVRGNLIGMNISGTLALSNTSGIAIYNGAQFNEIGSTIHSNQNLVGGNNAYGVYIAGSGTATNSVTFNSMGFDGLAGTLLPPNGGDNIRLTDQTYGNIIGELLAPNTLERAGGSGILVDGAAHANRILKNYVNANNRYGVLLDGSGTASNVISSTVITFNGVACAGCDGIGERNGAGPNLWTETSVYANAGLGIDKFTSSDASNTVNPPYLFINSVSGAGVVQGIANSTGIFVSTKVELYRVVLDPSGYGEGSVFVGSTFTDGGGHWTITDPLLLYHSPCYTAYATEVAFVFLGSTEFSRTNCSAMLPLIRR